MGTKERYTLIGANGIEYRSDTPGVFGGNTIKKNDRIYGRLDCPAALRAIETSDNYKEHRVFFANEADAIAAGYRPCGRCMPKEYREWKESRAQGQPAAIDEYISSQEDYIQPILKSVREAIRAELPDAVEKISYQMPTYWQKWNLIHFAAQKNHLGLYPGGDAVEHFTPRLADYKTSKGAIQFPYKAFSAEQLNLISEIAAWCGKEFAAK